MTLESPEKITKTQLYHGVAEEAKAPLCAFLVNESLKTAPKMSVLLVPDPRQAQSITAEIETYSKFKSKSGTLELLYFPEIPPPDIDTNRRADRLCERLSVLSALSRTQKGRRVIVLTPEALLGSCPGRTMLESKQLTLKVGEEHRFKDLIDRIITELNYDSEALCEHPGQIATRGGLIDIYPYDATEPYRIDFFGDEIESIRTFDPATQRSLKSLSKLVVAASVPEEENEGNDGNLIDYLPQKAIRWIFEEPAKLVRNHPFRFQTELAKKSELRSFYQIESTRKDYADQQIGICSIDTDSPLFHQAPRIDLKSEPSENYRLHGDAVQVGLDRFESEQSAREKFEAQIAQWSKKEKLEIIFITPSEPEITRVQELLGENPLTAKLKLRFHSGTISGGFIARVDENPETRDWLPFKISKAKKGLAVITDTEYFGRQRRKINQHRERARPTISQVDQLLDFTELADGDPLVHLQYGVCLFRGLTKLDIQGGIKEVISVEFAEQMTIHVPLHESHLLTRYVGLSKSAPKLAKIGGAAWQKTRQAAEVATLDYAAELLSLNAARSQSEGYAFPPDHQWQHTFEEAFPFKETPDQLLAIDATKQDMEQRLPMDRLICGDVGFGKTEVAIRAVLKSVLAGKQAAVLVPTTVLCQQHLNTFRERMAQYPLIIDSVSGFRSNAQNKEVISNLAEGKIDIIIGTHRLLSKDVHFQDLGLLVVDEEQRFGVRQKERIKKLRTDVDILTLSATPIPRTLYLAMSGARAMSVIETPPVDRRPIETIVKSYSHELVKGAIQAETDRGGQVFYLHNRVSTIEAVASKLREMHPKLTIGVGHGQMDDGQLEKVMTRFVAGDYDVLVCTTVIESGIDIPNCNTIIIEGADRFGLAQLYQIRGRVGRFKRQAYAYLLLHRHAALVDQAQKRLNALKQHNQLGAGFRIAMRDLELRGAGNLLGSQQSGHIAGIGFELYCQLLKQSVARLKGELGADRIRADVKLDFITAGEGGTAASRRTSGTFSFAAIKDAEYSGKSNQLIEAALPANYVAEPRLRIDLYRRLALAEDLETVREITEEIKDRFGKLPLSSKALIAVSEIRVMAEAAGVRRVESESDRLICRLTIPTKAKGGEFLKIGSRFPRISATDPLKRLAEIQTFLKRHRK